MLFVFSNPCTKENIDNKDFYHPHHDETKFVQCDEWGGCFVMPCPPGLIFNPKIDVCDWPPGHPGGVPSGE